MLVRKILFGRRKAKRDPSSNHLLLSFILLASVFCLCFGKSAVAKTEPAERLESGYVPALLAADHFLQAWQSGDVETGMALLTTHAKEQINSDGLDNFFAPALTAYEIGRGKMVKKGHYEFPVALIENNAKKKHPSRRFSTIIVLHSGGNDWAVDKLP
jgi:hypothetical protein